MEHIYQPVGSARELFYARDPEVLLSGPAGTGKSRACLEKVHALCLKFAGMRAVMLRKTAVSLTSTALVTFREHVAKEALESGEVRFFGGSGQEASSFKYGNGSTITIGGMDKATRIMSSEYDVAYVQEATELTENDWEAITTRLRHGVVPFQQVIADCNPDAPTHWLKNRFDTGRTRVVYCRHEDNPVLFDAQEGVWTSQGKSYISRLDALSGVRYERLRLGKWAAADGLIYDTFSQDVHLREGFRIFPPKDWQRYWSIDFGFTNPFVCQFWAEDPDGRLVLYREIYMSGVTVEHQAEAIMRMRTREHHVDPMPVAVICDHDAEGRATLQEKMGISTVPAHKAVLEGIDAVKSRLEVRADGKPRLLIARDALFEVDESLRDASKPICTQQEILEYTWSPSKEAPLKENDHGMDAMRYMVTFKDMVGRPKIRTLTWLFVVST